MKEREELFRVLIEQTGVETVVAKSYYEKYAKDGVRFLGVYSTGLNATPAAQEAGPYDAMTYDELKDAATLKGLEYPGNISKSKLVELLKEE